MSTNSKSKQPAKNTSRRARGNRSTLGASVIKGLEQAIAWTRGENENVRITQVQVPEVDVREVRTKMGLSQAQFATKFGFPPATLRNWEQGRARPDAPTRGVVGGDRQTPRGRGGRPAEGELIAQAAAILERYARGVLILALAIVYQSAAPAGRPLLVEAELDPGAIAVRDGATVLPAKAERRGRKVRVAWVSTGAREYRIEAGPGASPEPEMVGAGDRLTYARPE